MKIGSLTLATAAAAASLLANQAFAQAERFGAQRPAASAPGASPPSQFVAPPVAGAAAQPAAPLPMSGGSMAPEPRLKGGGEASSGMPSPREPSVDLVNESVDRIAPLTAEEVLQLRQELFRRSEAMRTNPSGRAPAHQTTSRFELDLSPGATPPVIRATPGQGVIVTFEDQSGKPWPVKLGDNFGKRNGVTTAEFTENSLSVDVARDTSMGNVAVALDGLPTPVVFTVVAGQARTDYWVQMVVPRFVGGRAPSIVSSPLPSFKARDLSDYLLRTPPASAKALKVEGLPGVLAWETKPGVMVLRTNALVTSPALNRLSSSDGMSVYEMAVTPSVMATLDGRFVSIKVSGYTVGGTSK